MTSLGHNESIYFVIILQVTEEEFTNSGKKIVVRAIGFSTKLMRLTAHSDLSSSDIDSAIEKVKYVLEEMKRSWKDLFS